VALWTRDQLPESVPRNPRPRRSAIEFSQSWLTFDGDDDRCRLLVDAVGRRTAVHSAIADRRVFNDKPWPGVRHRHAPCLRHRKLVAVPRDLQVRWASVIGRRVTREVHFIRRRRHDNIRRRWHDPRTIYQTVMLSPWGQSGLEAKILASASASNIWPRPGLDLVVLLCNRAFFRQKSCKIREFY